MLTQIYFIGLCILFGKINTAADLLDFPKSHRDFWWVENQESAQNVPSERLVRFYCIFYPQNVPMAQRKKV